MRAIIALPWSLPLRLQLRGGLNRAPTTALAFFASLGAVSAVVAALECLARRRAEQTLAEAELARQRAVEMLDRIQDGFFALDDEWRLTYVNRQASALATHLPPERRSASTLIGQRLWEAFPMAAASRFRDVAQRALHTGAMTALETYVAPLDRRLAFRIYPGRLGLSVYFQDVTGSEPVEDQLAQALARERAARASAEATEGRLAFLAKAGRVLADSLDYETTLQRIAKLAVPAIADVCIINSLEAGGGIRLIAEAHAEPAKEALLRELRKYPPRPDLDHPVITAIRTGQPQLYTEYPRAQVEATAYDGDHLHLLRELGFSSLIVAPLVARDHVLGAISLLTESSDRRLSAEDLPLVEALARRAAVAIDNARLFAAQERARAEAEAAVHLRDAFLASVTHDLKNPLTVIKGYSHLLRRMASNPAPARQEQLVEVLARIDAAASRMVRLLDELLDVARLEIGQPLSLDRQPTDLCALVRQIVAAEQQQAARCPIRLELEAPRLVGRWDAARLERVLDNLIANAIKYSPDQTEIVVRVATEEAWAILQVRDAGIGIPAEDVPHVFERFHRGRNVRGLIAGTGLGLWGSRLVVEQHGGTIGLESWEGKGTTVTVRLPLKHETPAQQPDRQD